VIVWFAWLGVVMLRTPSRAAAPASIAVTLEPGNGYLPSATG